MSARHLGAALSMLIGTAGVICLVVVLNSGLVEGPEQLEKAPVEVSMAPPPKPPKQKKQRRRPPRQSPQKAPPRPALSASLGGLDLGLGGFGEVGMEGLTEGLLGEVSEVVMSADSVDEVPVALETPQPEYPRRAQARGVTGHVTLNLLIAATGAVEDARVVDAQPPGVFDDVALLAAKRWRFQPAIYQGRPVAIRADQTIRFELDG